MSEQRSLAYRASPGDPILPFTEEVFAHLSRVDQRRWAHAYVKGLLEVRGKKTLKALAEAYGTPGAQRGLRQFVNASPWDWRPARQALLNLALRRTEVRAWTVGTVVIPKRGMHSVGVHRRFVPAAGRLVNCQLGHALFLSTDRESIPIDWTLELDPSWLDDRLRMNRARIPPEHHAPSPSAAHLFDAACWIAATPGAARIPFVADLDWALDVTPFLRMLADHGLDFAVRVGPDQPVTPLAPARTGGSRLRSPVVAGVPVPAGITHALSGGQVATTTTLGADGRPQVTTTTSSLVQLPGARKAGSATPGPVYRLLVVQRPSGRRWRDYWLTSLVGAPVGDILSLTRHPARTEPVTRVLENRFGVNDFEGRSFPGWHHHMTLVGAAYAFTRLHPPAEAAMRNRGDLSKFSLSNSNPAHHNESVELFETARA